MSDIKAGDVVTLKTGGPEMTVSGVGVGYSCCVWFCSEVHNYKTLECDPKALVAKKSSVGDITLEIKIEVKP